MSRVCQDIDSNTARFAGVTLLRAQAGKGLAGNYLAESITGKSRRLRQCR